MVHLTEILPADRRYEYDVFLSFRGADTRLGFVAHLLNALKFANLTTFYDDEGIETGLSLKPELESAIKASRASIIVLSKNYATSTWCLNELVLILDQHRKTDQIVIPIFFHVEPTHVRNQQNSFGEAMEKHKQRMEAETDAEKRSHWAQKTELWKKALADVADLKGKDAKGRNEPEFIQEIVTEIHRRLGGLPLRSTLPFLVGMELSIEFITSWLKDGSSHTADILTIAGMGGIGKTTLATYVYRLHHHEFHASSFIEAIGRTCAGKFNGLLDLQKQLCGGISKTSSIQVHDQLGYTSMIESVVANKKAFIVLDDIDSVDQLHALLGKQGFYPGSKIIMTTKYPSVAEKYAPNPSVQPKHTNHMLKGLNFKASRQLLSNHAFKSNKSKEGYEAVSKKLVKCCDGHPLALKVLGESLHGREVTEWEECIQKLNEETDSRIMNVLRVSFDSMPSKKDKELFKHIACFCVGMDIDYVETILKACDFPSKLGIKNLIDRCLLGICESNNTLTMHQLLQDMVKDMVRQESPNKPWKRSRLWCHEETVKVLKRKKGMENLLGLALDMSLLEKEDKVHLGSFELETDALSKMDSLMLLQLNYVRLNGSCKNFPQELRWLCIHGFSLETIPLDLPMKHVVVLDMSYSNIRSIDERLFGSLKILNLSFCKQLGSICGFFHLPALERLIAKNCESLVEVSESIEQCVELVYVDLSWCIKLKKLPRNLGKLKKVKTLLLDGCDLSASSEIVKYSIPSDLKFSAFTFPSSLVRLSLRFNNLVEVSESIEQCVELVYVDLSWCIKLKKLPRNLGKLKKVKTLLLDGCDLSASSAIVKYSIPSDLKFSAFTFPSSLVRLSLSYNNLCNESFPTDISGLSMLKELYLDCNPIVSMPNCVRTLPRLEILSMRDCKMLTSIEHPPRTLRQLVCNTSLYDENKLLRRIVFVPGMSPLALQLDHIRLPRSSFEMEGMVKIQAMAGIEEKVLRSLGWSNLEFLKKRLLGTYDYDTCVERGSQIQMYYEFGIFSTIYGGEEMPEWIRKRSKSKGPSTSSSISFTIPSSPNRKLKGLNFCCCLELPSYNYRTYYDLLGVPMSKNNFHVPVIQISNITKKRTWAYSHRINGRVSVGGRCLIYISHWMFGKNDMEAGDHVTITVADHDYWMEDIIIRECGYGVVYDEEGKAEEEDSLGYYKSWNHIIGGDLSPFLVLRDSTTTSTGGGEEEYYFLWTGGFSGDTFSRSFDLSFIGGSRYTYKEGGVLFTALSPRAQKNSKSLATHPS